MIRAIAAERVIIDTGPMVALLNRRDANYERCINSMAEIRPPLLTCWPVLVEAAWMLRDVVGAQCRLLQSIDDRHFRLLDVVADELPSIDAIMQKYRDLSPQLADAAIVHLAQREGIETIFTLDRRDFTAYRLHGKKKFRLLPEE